MAIPWTCSRHFSPAGRVRSIEASVNFCRVKGGGFVGKGCVSAARSPFTPPCGTRRSSIGKIGSPVSRSNTNR